jgi:ferredoxin-nitrite reductase
MWRFRCPNGSFTLKQWKVINDQVREYAKEGDQEGDDKHWKKVGCYSLTTRQNVQLFGIRLENLPRHWKALRDAGVFSVQSGMDNVRNCVGNPLAGIDPEELIDTRPYCQGFTDKLTNNGMGNPDFTNLPRKFNVCFVGSKEMYEHPHINDIAYVPAVDANGLKVRRICIFVIILGIEILKLDIHTFSLDYPWDHACFEYYPRPRVIAVCMSSL